MLFQEVVLVTLLVKSMLSFSLLMFFKEVLKYSWVYEHFICSIKMVLAPLGHANVFTLGRFQGRELVIPSIKVAMLEDCPIQDDPFFRTSKVQPPTPEFPSGLVRKTRFLGLSPHLLLSVVICFSLSIPAHSHSDSLALQTPPLGYGIKHEKWP